jgi:hypothetical protein
MPPKKTVIQKDGMLYIIDHPTYPKSQVVNKAEDKQPTSIIMQCYENYKKLGVTYPHNIQSQFRLLETTN